MGESGALTDGALDPVSWYQTRVGETLLSLAGLFLVLSAYTVLRIEDAPWYVQHSALAAGVVGLGMLLTFSKRAAMKAACRPFGEGRL
ncbi:hypothetical protein [Halomicrococcus sp. SG-WS-1]|uniref:hypothetical protein n=1 Tax=Halomicrococcus sp. SG-WS-1 TaxID=3439057 RepID=UPI003F794C3E